MWRATTSSRPPASSPRSESVEGIFNSRGLNDWHTQTSSEISITMLAGDSSGWQKANSPDVSQLDPAALAEISARKALDSAQSARNSRRQVHRHSRACGGARPGRLHVLGFRRPLDPRPTLVLEQSRRHPDLRREYQHLGRRGSSTAVRHAIRRRRRSPAAGAPGGERRGQTAGVRARHREKDGRSRNTKTRSVLWRPRDTDSLSPTKWARPP